MTHIEHNLRRIARLLPFAVFSVFLVSCLPSGGKGLALPSTPSILGDPGWLLVKEAYATLKTQPGISKPDAGHLRDGLVLEIHGRAYAEGKNSAASILWYLVTSDEGSGWLSSADCEVFASKEQALRSLGQGKQG